ncbi:hypothetical protein GQ457_11G027500 [Hibiscus cannabinus]
MEGNITETPPSSGESIYLQHRDLTGAAVTAFIGVLLAILVLSAASPRGNLDSIFVYLLQEPRVHSRTAARGATGVRGDVQPSPDFKERMSGRLAQAYKASVGKWAINWTMDPTLYVSFWTSLLFLSSYALLWTPELLSAMENLQFTEKESATVVTKAATIATDEAKNVSEIVELRPNFFLIKPASAEVTGMVLKRRPWVVHGDLFSIEAYNPAWCTDDYDFTNMAIWARVYKLPMRAMNIEMGLRLGGCIGKALDIDHRIEGGNMGDFLRVRVQVDIKKPLHRCVLLSNGHGKQHSTCPLRYERLPRFCFFCGIVGHKLSTCSVKPATLDVKKLQYGSWLRVLDRQPRPTPQRRTGVEYFDHDSSSSIPQQPGHSHANTLGNSAPPPPGTMTVNDSEAVTPRPVVSNLPSAPLGQPAVPPSVTSISADDSSTANTWTGLAPLVAVNGLDAATGLTKVATGASGGQIDTDDTVADGSLQQPVVDVPPRQPERIECPPPVLSTGVTRAPKRTIQGRYEVCCPIQPKRARVLPHDSSTNGLSTTASDSEHIAGKSSLNSPTEPYVMLLWNRRITVNLLSYSPIHIDVTVASVSGSFHFSGLHGVKEGVDVSFRGFLDTFRDCLDRNNLLDCKPISGWSTWLYINSVSGTVIQEQLDRFMATVDWFSLFPDYRVSSIYTPKSDHCFLLMDASQVNVFARGGTSDYFRFDTCWSKEDACIERVRSTWLHSPDSTVSKLQAIGNSLRCWQANRRVSSTKRMSDLQVFLNSCMQDSIIDVAKAAFLDAKREHKSLLDKDEAYWAQRARVTWLTQGDRNTAYFHARASGRRKKNRIRGLFNENGIWTDKQAEVAGVAMRYFTTLFSSSQPTPNSSLLSNIDHCISSNDNTSLLRPFTDAEIITAFQDINPTKAPGIDGLPGNFFRQHWELIGSDIIQLFHDLLSRKIDMSCVNATTITLISKVEDPVRMQQLRPISLHTVVYKIVSKTILNRMKPFLPGCISENQSTFLKGRLISDNILIAHELLHYLCSSKNLPNKGTTLKFDMEKAFDRVEWTFLRSVLLHMGFHSDWVDHLMDCVSTVTFRIRINGRLTPTIVPQRGLWQGDPLSSFLFVICMQGLSATLLAEQGAG